MADATKEVVVLGAGYGGVRAVIDLTVRLTERNGARITLVNKHDYHQFITELHKSAAGTARASAVRVPLREIMAGRPVKLVKGTIAGIDRQAHLVRLEGAPEIRYDKLIIALGSDPEYFNVPGLAEHSFTIRSLNSARLIRTHIVQSLAESKAATPEVSGALRTFVVAGGGLTGVEFAGELAEALPDLAKEYDIPVEDLKVLNVEAAPDIMGEFDPALVAEAKRVLEEKGVRVVTGSPITGVTGEEVQLKSGEVIHTRTVVWAGGVRGVKLIQESGLAVKARGRAEVNTFLQSVTDSDIWVIGDCALAIDPDTGNFVAPTAHHAIEQGEVAAHNVAAVLTGGEMAPYRPHDLGAVASLGKSAAVGNMGRFKATGRTASLLKEMIEIRYLFSIGGPRLVFRRLRE